MRADDLINKKRDSAASFKVGDSNDTAPICDMFTIDGNL